MIKRKSYIVIIIFLLLLVFLIPCTFCESSDDDLEMQMEENVYEILGRIDLTQFDGILGDLDKQSQSVFSSNSFSQKITDLLNGNFENDFSSFILAFLNCFFGELAGIIPLVSIIIGITVLCSIIENIRSDINSDSISKIIDFVCFGAIIVVIFGSVFGLLNDVTNCINSIKKQMDLIFPILLTLLASVGGAVSVGLFQPSLAILSNLVIQCYNYFLVPLFIFMLVFLIVGHINSNIKLDKFNSFFSSVFKWSAGVTFSLFMGILTMQGIVAGSFDSVSIRATKFALKSYIPILGGYLSDGFNIAIASSILIKNAIGLTGVILSISTILLPIAKIAVLSLSLKLCAGILEPMTKSNVPNFLIKVSKLLNLLLVILVGIGFMYIVSIGLLLCTANVG